jgi:hypothetical protein
MDDTIRRDTEDLAMRILVRSMASFLNTRIQRDQFEDLARERLHELRARNDIFRELPNLVLMWDDSEPAFSWGNVEDAADGCAHRMERSELWPQKYECQKCGVVVERPKP